MGAIGCVVPRGSRHLETGILLEGPFGLILRRDDGGEWQLDAPVHARRLLGQRVRLEGVRDGFDLLAVQTIEPVNGKSPARPSLSDRVKVLVQRLSQW